MFYDILSKKYFSHAIYYIEINNLKTYRGTMTYMAPEIKENKVYDGIKIDLFSTAVILFIIV